MDSTIRHIGKLSNHGVFIFNISSGNFEYVNDHFAGIFDLEKELLLQQARLVLPFIRSEDSYYLKQRYNELVKNQCIANTEFRLHFSDGSIKHLTVDAYLIDKDHAAGFLKDITREKQHEDYIINYGAKKDTLLDMMNHNLSGPLNLSQNIIRWMQQKYQDKMPAEIYSQLHLIQSNTQECLDIINDFLKEEHLESEKIYVKKTRFDVLERIMTTLQKLVATNKNKKFRVRTDLDNLNITTDSVKFFQIIHNLVSNAIKFTPDQGKIDIHVEEKPSSFIVSVSDDGIGIPEKLQPLLFDRNSPASRKGLNKEDSSGMGLHIVKTLVQLLDGKIWFESKENEGTTFYVEFPKE